MTEHDSLDFTDYVKHIGRGPEPDEVPVVCFMEKHWPFTSKHIMEVGAGEYRRSYNLKDIRPYGSYGRYYRMSKSRLIKEITDVINQGVYYLTILRPRQDKHLPASWFSHQAKDVIRMQEMLIMTNYYSNQGRMCPMRLEGMTKDELVAIVFLSHNATENLC